MLDWRTRSNEPIDGLAACLSLLFDQPSTVEDLRLRAAELARTEYDWDIITDQYEEMFNRLASRNVAGQFFGGRGTTG